MKKKAFRRRHRGHVWFVLGVLSAYLLMAGLVTYGVLWTYQRFRTHERFAVSYIEVESVSAQVAQEVEANLDWVVGQNVFVLDLNRVKCEALKHRWVEDAVVRREMPNRVRVSLVERDAKGLALVSGELMVVDEAGALICAAHECPRFLDVPVMTGLESVDDRPSAIRRGLSVLDDVRQASLVFWGRVESLEVSDASDYVARLSHMEPVFHLGDRVIPENIRNYLAIAEHVHERYPHMEYVELGFCSQVVVKPHSSEGLD